MSIGFIDKNGWNNFLLNYNVLIKEGEERSDVMRSFDWAARRLIDNENQEIPKDFQSWYKNFDDYSIKDQIFHDYEVRVVYWDILGDLCDDLFFYIRRRFKRCSINMTEHRQSTWEDEIQEAFFEFLEAYKALSYENLFEEAVHKNTQKK